MTLPALATVVTPKAAKALATLNVTTTEELLRHYPRRYARRGDLSDLGSLRVGETVTVFAEVLSSRSRATRQRGRTMLEVVVTDGTGRLTLTFFGQAWRERQLTAGRRGMFSGKVGEFRGTRQLSHPEYVLIPYGDDVDADAVAAFASEIIPVYPASAAIPSWRVAACVELALPYVEKIVDPLPESVRNSQQLPPLSVALRGIHRPAAEDEIESAIARLKFDEAFILQAELLRRRHENRKTAALPRPTSGHGVLAKFDSGLPYPLTAGQITAGEHIAADISRGWPMQRLLQGEVGSGKTVVALRAMLTVADAGGQSALLAPTEVLAQQHFSSIRALLGSLAGDGIVSEPGAVTVTLLTGSMSQPAKRQALMEISSGAAGIVIGTHALLQDTVQFADLGLVVVDEQHRFGVEQRARLTGKSADATRPHLLVMTATPIPRTVAMTVFADLDISTLTELPAGRAPITTHVVAASEQPRHLVRVWQRVVEEVGLGRKAYVVCPRIGGESPSADDSEAHASHGAVELYAQLTSHELAGMRVGLLHGRLPADEKDAVMKRFALPSQSEDALDVLVATTVIEVGVDVPTASVMIVMDADRFGISQLHQLRGRVGRGGLPGLCLLVTDSADESARERLTVIASTTDGFALSEYDLTVRREGDVLGAEQSGRASSLKLLQVLHDQEVVAAAREEAAALIELDSTFEKFPELRDAITLLTQNRAEYLEKS